jgi:hypothetical protein
VAEQAISKRRFATPNPGPTLLLGAFLYLGHIWHSITTLRGAPPAGAFGLLYYIGMPLVIANWIRADKHRLGITSTFDDGFFIFFAWPLVLPYYLFASRGLRGGLAVLGFVGLYLFTYALTLPIYFGLRYLFGEVR